MTSELIKVISQDGEQFVSARELHSGLETGTRFNDWMQRRIKEYGFTEGEDFYSILSKTQSNGRPSKDFQISIDMAKELSMVEHNELGRKFRKYFIEMEKRARHQQQRPLTLPEQMKIVAQGYNELHEDVQGIKDDVQELRDNEQIRNWERKQLLEIRRSKVRSYTTGITDKEKLKAARSKLYQAIGSDFKQHFNLPAYDALPRKQFTLGRDFIINWTPDEWTRAAIAGMELQEA